MGNIGLQLDIRKPVPPFYPVRLILFASRPLIHRQ